MFGLQSKFETSVKSNLKMLQREVRWVCEASSGSLAAPKEQLGTILQCPPSEIQYQLSSMSTTQRMRERVEQSRRTCLMRKVRLCEYLLGYGNSLDLRPRPPPTANSFFPHINFHATVPTNRDLHTPRAPQLRSSDDSLAFPLRAASKASRREELRPSERKLVSLNVSELTAKSMTPSTRVSEGGEESGLITAANSSTMPAARKAQLTRRCSPRKRTYIGGAHYVRDASIAQPSKPTPPRKHSIAPWDIELENL